MLNLQKKDDTQSLYHDTEEFTSVEVSNSGTNCTSSQTQLLLPNNNLNNINKKNDKKINVKQVQGKKKANKKKEKQIMKTAGFSQIRSLDEIFINYFQQQQGINIKKEILNEDQNEISKNKRKYEHFMESGQVVVVQNKQEKEVLNLHEQLFRFSPDQVIKEKQKRIKACIVFKPEKFLNPFSVYILKNGYIIDEELMTKIINKKYYEPVQIIKNNNYFKSVDFVLQDQTQSGQQFTSVYLKEIQDNVVSMDYIIERFNSFETNEYKFLSDNIDLLEKSFQQVRVSQEEQFEKLIYHKNSKMIQTQELIKKGIEVNEDKPLYVLQFDLRQPHTFCDLQNIHVTKSFLEILGYTPEEYSEAVMKKGIIDLHAYKNPQSYFDQLRRIFLSMVNKNVDEEDETLYVFIKKSGEYVELKHSKVWWVDESGYSFYGARLELA